MSFVLFSSSHPVSPGASWRAGPALEGAVLLSESEGAQEVEVVIALDWCRDQQSQIRSSTNLESCPSRGIAWLISAKMGAILFSSNNSLFLINEIQGHVHHPPP